MIARQKSVNPSVFSALRTAGVKLWNFGAVTTLLQDFLLGRYARELLDFELAFVPTLLQWNELLLTALSVGWTNNLVERIVELGSFTEGFVQTIIYKTSQHLKALKTAQSKKKQRETKQ